MQIVEYHLPPFTYRYLNNSNHHIAVCNLSVTEMTDSDSITPNTNTNASSARTGGDGARGGSVTSGHAGTTAASTISSNTTTPTSAAASSSGSSSTARPVNGVNRLVPIAAPPVPPRDGDAAVRAAVQFVPLVEQPGASQPDPQEGDNQQRQSGGWI